ncbi:MAG TPA: S8 family serine peptidase [Bryobacteraceae bacterium]|nr:S8 family serine peptidase [Bryobacteraceae bacterium]
MSLVFGVIAHAQTSDEMVDVIVQYRSSQAWTTHTAGAHHAIHRGSFHSINAEALTVPQSELAALANDPDVAHISPNLVLSAAGVQFDYTEDTVFAPAAWLIGQNGNGIGVAVIDSGVSAMNDWGSGSASRLVYSESFVNLGTSNYDKSTADAYGHGTHVAGIIGANGATSTNNTAGLTIQGLAPKVNIVNLRALDQNGGGRDSDVIAAIDRAIQLKNTYNIRIINLSLGRPVYESYKLDPLCQAVEAAWNAGILVVVAAGNNGRDNSHGTQGYGTITAPGNDPYVLTVGAMKSEGTSQRGDDTMASYSSKGPTAIDHIVKPDLVAPGNRIISLTSTTSTLYKNYSQARVQLSTPQGAAENFLQLSGTSMAAAVASGAAALLFDLDGTLSPDTVKARLMKSASKDLPDSTVVVDTTTGSSYVSSDDVFTVGAGYLNVLTALLTFDSVNSGKSAISPTASFDSKSKKVTMLNSNGIVWGTNVVWGTNIVWGTSIIAGLDSLGNSLLTGSNVVWGTGSPNATNVIWGTNVVWGTTTVDSPTLTVNGEN